MCYMAHYKSKQYGTENQRVCSLTLQVCKHIVKTKLNNVYFSLKLSFGLLPSFANLGFTPEINIRSVPSNMFKPSSIFLLTVPGGSFLLFVFRVCHAVLSDHCSLVVTCWERADFLAVLRLMFDVFLCFCHFLFRCGT